MPPHDVRRQSCGFYVIPPIATIVVALHAPLLRALLLPLLLPLPPLLPAAAAALAVAAF